MSEAESFFGRWARRKAEARSTTPVASPEATPAAPALVPPATPVPPVRQASVERPDAPRPAEVVAAPGERPTLTLDDVRRLGADSDYSPFVASDVAPEVRNAALKKLFADPKFNVMDGLDIYIDDYSRPDPLPTDLARRLVSAQFMQLFDEPRAAEAEPPTGTESPPALPAAATLDSAGAERPAAEPPATGPVAPEPDEPPPIRDAP